MTLMLAAVKDRSLCFNKINISAGRSILGRRCRWNRAPGPGMRGNERECEGMRGPARRPTAKMLSGLSGGRPKGTEGYYSNTGFSPQAGAMDATAVFSHLLSSNKLQASPLHPPHGGGREGAGRRRCRMAPEVQAGTVFPPCDGVL